MKVNYCQQDHFEKVKYYVSSSNTAICEDCHSKFMKDGMECTSIDSMGNAYLCDIRSVRDKWAVVHDEICAKQAKYQLLFEKLYDSIAGAFESFLSEIERLKESMLNEANSEKSKFIQNYNVDVVETKTKIKGETETLSSHMENIETLLKTSVYHLLLPLIDTVDVPAKINEINFFKNSLENLLLKEPQLPFIINRRQFNKPDVLSLIGIIKNNYQITLENPQVTSIHTIRMPNEPIIDPPPSHSVPFNYIPERREIPIISPNEKLDTPTFLPTKTDHSPFIQVNSDFSERQEFNIIPEHKDENYPLERKGYLTTVMPQSYNVDQNKNENEIVQSPPYSFIPEERDNSAPYSEIQRREANSREPVVIVKSPSKMKLDQQEILQSDNHSELKNIQKSINQPMLHYVYFSKLYIYDISREKKYIIDTPPSEIFPCKNFPSIIVRDSIFLCGGSTPDGLCLRTTFTFDYNTMEFIQRKSMISGRCKHGLTDIGNNLVYIIGGYKSKNSIKECAKYDLDLDKWIFVPPLNEEKALVTSFSFRNRMIYTIGGLCNAINGFASAIERLDVSNEEEGWSRVDFRTNGWSARFAMNNCQLSDQYFLIFGGANITYQNHCFLYDCNSDTLMFISRLQQGAKFESQQSQPVLYKDNVYAIDDERNLHIFDIRNNSWTLIRWSQWKPNATKSPQPPNGLRVRK